MGSPRSKTGQGAQFFHFDNEVFVGSNKPFVGYIYPSVYPFVCKNRPFIRIHGFTLIELVVTLAVAAILVTAAVPALRTFIQNSRITTQANDVLADISFARSEAIRQGRNVEICTSIDGTACNGVGVWTTGRLIWSDINNDGSLDPEEILRYREAVSGSTNSLIAITGLGPAATLTLDRAGTLPLCAPIGVTDACFRFSVCDERGANHGRDVSVNRIGQARVETPSSCP
jgi:type IV fimbrial biogenesis protein FimT